MLMLMLAGSVAVVQRVAMHHHDPPFATAASCHQPHRPAQTPVEAGDAQRQRRDSDNDDNRHDHDPL